MKVRLNCSKVMERILTEILLNRNIEIDDESNFEIVEDGFEGRSGNLLLVFNKENIVLLMDFIDSFSKSGTFDKKMITGKQNDNYVLVPYEQVIYFEAAGNDVYCITENGRYLLKDKLYALEESLKSSGFIRVSKAVIVNIVKVAKIIPWFNGKLLLKMEADGQEIYVTRSYSKEFKNFLGI